jgi:predicted metal-dependent hydrolase
MTMVDADARIEKLSAASLRRVIEPDVDVPGQIGPGAVLAPALLSVADLDLDLTAEQLATLSREEVASITDAGIRFEAILISGFALDLVGAPDLTDPRIVYALHELGEETRHSRLFVRLLTQLGSRAKNPLDNPIGRRLRRFGAGLASRRPALLDVLVLAGEEIPDLMQKRAAEDPGTDPFIVSVNRYHRQEEARHLAFARTVLPEHWAGAAWHDRFAVRHGAPLAIRGMFNFIVHPGVYRVVGLPGWRTWRAANASPVRVALRKEATRPVLAAVLQAGIFAPGRVPGGWRDLCGVDAAGQPVP